MTEKERENRKIKKLKPSRFYFENPDMFTTGQIAALKKVI